MNVAVRGISRLGLAQGKSRNASDYGGGRKARDKAVSSRQAGRESRLPLARMKMNRPKAAPGQPTVTVVGKFISRTFTIMLICAALAGVSIGLLAGYRWLTTINYFEIRDLQVTGTNRMSREDVLAQAELPQGANLLAVNMENLEARLTRNPWIESAQVTRVLPGTLKIRVTEREPSYLVQYEDSLCYADAAGRIIDKVRADTFVSLPQVEVESGMERHLPLLEELRKAIADNKSPFGLDQVAWIRLSWRYGLEIRLMDRNVLLCVGVEDYKANLAHLGLVWANLTKRGELDQVAIISAQNRKVWVEKHG